MKSLSKLFVSLILFEVIVVSFSTQKSFAEDLSIEEVTESMIVQQPVDENIYEENIEIADNIIAEKDDILVVEEELQASGYEKEEFFEPAIIDNPLNLEEVKEAEVSDLIEYAHGRSGTSTWKIFKNGLLLIGSGELANTDNVSPWHSYVENITHIEFEVGVYAASDSSSLFARSKAVSFIGISNLDTSRVTDMSSMFQGMSNLLELDVSNFNTSKATNMFSMFSDVRNILELNVSNFDTSKATNMGSMFNGMRNLLELDVSNFDTSKATNISNMFNGLGNVVELDVSNFDTSQVTNMYGLFNGVSNVLELDVSTFDTSKVTNLGHMFNGVRSVLELDVSNFDTSKATNISAMFNGMYSLLDLDINNFDTLQVTDMSYMFSGMTSVAKLNVRNFDTSKVTNIAYMFEGMSSLLELDVSSFDTSQVTNMSYMFGGMSSLLKLNVSNFDTSKATNISNMFNGLGNVVELDVSNFDTSQVTNMGSIFKGMSNILELDASSFDTSKATNMGSMFNGMSNLLELDVSSFDTSQITNMSNMFNGMSSVLELNLSNFDTSQVTNMNNMFNGMSSVLELNLSNFDTSQVTTMNYMFYQVANLNTLTLGSNFRFIGIDTQLATISKTGYTGRWIGTTTGQIFENSLDLTTNFAGQADTYIWEEEYVVVNPPETNPEVTIPPTVPSSGPLTIAYASQFNFGEQVISSKDQTYSVLAEMHELTDTQGETPYVSFAQIQDTRVNNEGWSLSITASEFTSNTQNKVLEGAQIILGAPTFIHTGSTDEGISVHDGVLNLIPGASSLLMKSENGEGTGSTSIIWGDQATLNNSVDEKVRNDAIQLVVPGVTTKDAATYKATLSWELMATPSNEI